MKLIEDRLKEVGTNSNIGRILVSTIDGFQGLERETVILSLGETRITSISLGFYNFSHFCDLAKFSQFLCTISLT